MTYLRTLFAVLVALSLAMPPAMATTALSVTSHEMTEMSVDHAADDCCPGTSKPSQKLPGDCALMATCALCCLNVVSVVSSPLVYPTRVASLIPAFARGMLRPYAASPPFRPPRV
jgi:hypothetical protein